MTLSPWIFWPFVVGATLCILYLLRKVNELEDRIDEIEDVTEDILRNPKR